jgi:hypothetical protein
MIIPSSFNLEKLEGGREFEGSEYSSRNGSQSSQKTPVFLLRKVQG